MNTAEQESLDEILRKTRRENIKQLVKALSQINYITDIHPTEGHYWSEEFQNYKDVIEFKLKMPVHPDVDELMKTIFIKVNANCLKADVHLNYEIDQDKYEILIEPKKGITSPPKMTEAVNKALDRTTSAVKEYVNKNPSCKKD